MIKHICNLSDDETILQLQEKMYMQYFIGYSSFSNEAPFDPSLFVEIRKRFGVEQINAINDKIVELSQAKKNVIKNEIATTDTEQNNPPPSENQSENISIAVNKKESN
ncbi:hypothetical protein BH11PAT1_BH11PAT1_7360 [soil metagenome]